MVSADPPAGTEGHAGPAPAAAVTTVAVTNPITVASVPSRHVYVRHLSPESGGGPSRLPDPPPRVSGRSLPQQWWPPAMLDPGWVENEDFDLFHLHFGFDAKTPAELAILTRALRRRGKPFVFTVHDLRNPHHESRALHDAQLDVLVPAADALITLTEGAAAEIGRRWGRECAVLPHPHVVDLKTMAIAQDRRARRRVRCRVGGFRVGLHLKSLRPSMDPLALLPTLVETVRALPDAVLQVNAHRDVLEPDGRRFERRLARLLRHEAAAGRLELHVHDYFSDEDLWCYLDSLDASVLPYRFGTHSGWLEACRDLGTTVIAPSCGYYAEQGPVLGYRHDEDRFDADSLAAALTRAYLTRPAYGAGIEERRGQRRRVAAGHDLIYRSLVGDAVAAREGAAP